MKIRIMRQLALWCGCTLLLPLLVNAQGTLADYERAKALRTKFQSLALNLPDRARWIEKTNRFWYTRTVKSGSEFVLVDAEILTKKLAFDHEKLAAALTAAAGEKYKALELPIDGNKQIEINNALFPNPYDMSNFVWEKQQFIHF